MANPPPVNYAYYVGIKSVAAAAVAAAIYVPIFGFYIWRTMRHFLISLLLIDLFCLVRITGFGLRAYIASKTSAQQNQTLIIVQSIIYGVGFFGVLNSLYNLQIDRHNANGKKHNIFSKITGNPHLVHLALTGAVVLNIIGTIDVNDSDASKHDRGKTFRIISAIAFVGITGLLVVRSLFSLRDPSHGSKIGQRHAQAIILLIANIFMVREVYLVITVNNATAQRNETLFYILEALPELVGVLLMAIPGLIPDKYDNQGDLPSHYGNNASYGNSNNNNVYAPSGNNVYAPSYNNDSQGYLMK